MSKPELSVVVPVYNAGSYLERCINSILGQQGVELELIIVDDGSSDGSETICDEYAERDPRIRVIHKKNAGVSAARNDGIEAATASYIAFVDGDDYIDSGMYARLFEQQRRTGSDLVYCGFRRVFADCTKDNSFPKEQNYGSDQVSAFAEEMFCGKIFGSVCRSLYARSAIGDERFQTENAYAEDLLFNLHVLKHAKAVSVIPDVFYNYNQTNENSVCVRTVHDPDFRYTKALQGQLEVNKYWNFPIDGDRFYMVYVDMMFQFLVRKLEEGGNEALVRQYLTDGFFASCCHYDKNIPLRRRIICILIRKRWFRLAVLVRKAEDAVLKLLGR